jgi:SAM-dependent methyltransferase
MKKALKKIPLASFCYDYLKKLISHKQFKNDFEKFRRLSSNSDSRLSLDWNDRYPCLEDATSDTGFDRHYVFHTAWAARVLALNKPESHIDISSSIYFTAISSAFVPIKFYDYRAANLDLPNLETGKADLTSLTFESNSIKSLSCMHVVEHIGLGRYGDTFDPDGDIKAIAELKRVLAVGGSLLFVVPIGKPKVMFNAHRIYSYDQVISFFDDFKLIEFALIPDSEKDGNLIPGASREMADAQHYGCGCFWFRKTGVPHND